MKSLGFLLPLTSHHLGKLSPTGLKDLLYPKLHREPRRESSVDLTQRHRQAKQRDVMESKQKLHTAKGPSSMRDTLQIDWRQYYRSHILPDKGFLSKHLRNSVLTIEKTSCLKKGGGGRTETKQMFPTVIQRMPEWYEIKCSALLIVMELLFKTTMNDDFTSLGWLP